MPTYGDYLKLDELLALQHPLSRAPEHDEMLFIVIHQVYELWFKEILHEIDYLQELLSRNQGIRAGHTLKRVLTILKVMVAQLDILETMTPLWDAFLRHLAMNGIAVPAEDLERDVTRKVEGSPGLRTALIEVYRHHPALAELSERLVDLDEGLMEWRYRHVKMVQRTIGTRRGTGGSAGAEYLTTTLNQPLFPDLWAIRTEL
jgi:tryptophan 2,3-dioxygenase